LKFQTTLEEIHGLLKGGQVTKETPILRSCNLKFKNRIQMSLIF
jgi:hypothetical protein